MAASRPRDASCWRPFSTAPTVLPARSGSASRLPTSRQPRASSTSFSQGHERSWHSSPRKEALPLGVGVADLAQLRTAPVGVRDPRRRRAPQQELPHALPLPMTSGVANRGRSTMRRARPPRPNAHGSGTPSFGYGAVLARRLTRTAEYGRCLLGRRDRSRMPGPGATGRDLCPVSMGTEAGW
jgi:hypothetical protein